MISRLDSCCVLCFNCNSTFGILLWTGHHVGSENTVTGFHIWKIELTNWNIYYKNAYKDGTVCHKNFSHSSEKNEEQDNFVSGRRTIFK